MSAEGPPCGGILPETLSQPRFPVRSSWKSLGAQPWPGATGHPGGHPPAQPPASLPCPPPDTVSRLPASAACFLSPPVLVCFSSRNITSHGGSHPKEVAFWRHPSALHSPITPHSPGGYDVGGGGPGGQAAPSGSQDFVSRWLLVQLVESGAGVRAALTSASWEGALEVSLLVLAPLPAPVPPPLRGVRQDLGQSPGRGGLQSPPAGLSPWCPGPWASLGPPPPQPPTPRSGLVGAGTFADAHAVPLSLTLAAPFPFSTFI